MSKIELKSCPFCGGEMIVKSRIADFDTNERIFFLEHKDSAADCPLIMCYANKDEVAEAWKKRVVIELPCAVGDTVYFVNWMHCATNPDEDYYYVSERKFEYEMIEQI